VRGFRGTSKLDHHGLTVKVFLWGPPYTSIHKTERFKTLVRTARLVEYWRERGWPDLSRPMGSDDFVCD
jgi:hypothetical protein